MKKINFYRQGLAIIATGGINLVFAQNTILSSGSDATGPGGSVSYSIGQIVYNTNSNPTSGSVSQGVQQPYETYVLGIEDNSIDVELTIYPNPVSDVLYLTVDELMGDDLNYHLIDLTGKTIERGKLLNHTTKISLLQLPPSTYILEVKKENNNIKSFKILKNQL